jgi:hypothetical protein
MITYFTSVKDFTGSTKIAQVNAIRSWHASTPQAEVVIFGACEGIQTISADPGLILQPTVKVSDQGTPFVNEMFEKINRIASHPICCFVNADIILTPRFVCNTLAIHKLLDRNYLVVGQRYDIDINHGLDFSADWEARLEKLIASSGAVHPASGSDFFVFPKGQYLPGDMPDLLVGRGGWDLWMIYNGRVRKRQLVDLSPTVKVIHQNHSYNHRKVEFQGYRKDDEALANLRHLPKGETYDYTLPACTFVFKDGRLHRNFARGDLKRYLTYELNLRKHNPLFRILKKICSRLRLTYGNS